MPVYYEERDERRAFIRDVLRNTYVSIDTSCFAGYLYKDFGSGGQELEYKQYDKIMEKVKHRFPRTDIHILFKDVFSVIIKMEDEYIKAWMGEKDKGTSKHSDPHDYSFMYDYNPNWSDC